MSSKYVKLNQALDLAIKQIKLTPERFHIEYTQGDDGVSLHSCEIKYEAPNNNILTFEYRYSSNRVRMAASRVSTTETEMWMLQSVAWLFSTPHRRFATLRKLAHSSKPYNDMFAKHLAKDLAQLNSYFPEAIDDHLLGDKNEN